MRTSAYSSYESFLFEYDAATFVLFLFGCKQIVFTVKFRFDERLWFSFLFQFEEQTCLYKTLFFWDRSSKCDFTVTWYDMNMYYIF